MHTLYELIKTVSTSELYFVIVINQEFINLKHGGKTRVVSVLGNKSKLSN